MTNLAAATLGLLSAVLPGAQEKSHPLRPFLRKYCTECHGSRKPEADLNLASGMEAALKDDGVLRSMWKMLDARRMPPAGSAPPPEPARDAVIGWVESTLQRRSGVERDPGRVVLRRLSRVEYRNTIRDLVGVDVDVTEDFPSDDIGYGFDNIGDVLSLPPLLLEKYLRAARRILDRAVVVPPDPAERRRRIAGAEMKTPNGHSLDGSLRVLVSTGEAYGHVGLAEDGRYVVRARAGGDQAGPEPVRIALRIDGKEVGRFDVKGDRRHLGTFEVKTTLKKGSRRVGIAFLNDYYKPEAKDPRQRDRNLVFEYVEVEGPVDVAPKEPPASHRLIFGEAGRKDADAEGVLSRFVRRAFRRPAGKEEVGRYVELFRLARKQGEAFEAAMKLPLQAVLVSPHFLFRIEDDRPDRGRGVVALNDHELAVRLSYFLWSSMPDAELMKAADEGRLGREAELERQVRRMLRDPRSRALAENFAIQWLQLRRLDSVAPDAKAFPGFDEKLRRAMAGEVTAFFDAVLREDRSIHELLDSDFTFLNERLAKHYGIDGVEGEEFRRVSLKDRRRGGVLTMGGVLAVTSNPTRTSPVLRGKWVLEVILGTPPAPPPPNAGDLADEPEDVRLPLRERLVRHRRDPVCAACHATMDPIGFGLENFDGIGKWRDRDGKHPIDASATLPGGVTFRGPVELKRILMSRKEQFLWSFTERLLTYALGRGVEYYDARASREIRAAAGKDGAKLSRLILEVVKSHPFRHRRNMWGE